MGSGMAPNLLRMLNDIAKADQPEPEPIDETAQEGDRVITPNGYGTILQIDKFSISVKLHAGSDKPFVDFKRVLYNRDELCKAPRYSKLDRLGDLYNVSDAVQTMGAGKTRYAKIKSPGIAIVSPTDDKLIYPLSYHIKEAAEKQGMNMGDLMLKLDIGYSRYRHELMADEPITDNMALRLADTLGETKDHWQKLDADYKSRLQSQSNFVNPIPGDV